LQGFEAADLTKVYPARGGVPECYLALFGVVGMIIAIRRLGTLLLA
jgi:hypothetical protein